MAREADFPISPNAFRTHLCGAVRAAEKGREITLSGWVQTRRDHGGLIFIDLRDRTGLCQIVFNPQVSREAHAAAEHIRSEFVLTVTGKVELRPKESVNPKLKTGEIEVYVSSLKIQSEAKTTPFEIEDDLNVDEALRLKYRYLDLRRRPMRDLMIFRSKVVKTVHRFLDENGFVEVETPDLTKSTPEGARDFLVPSRLQPSRFYALPQSPQLFKQILMIAGFDRYYQMARCFRDEDLRADRQPEHTQIDLEMSFVTRDDIIALMEQMIAAVFKENLGRDLELPLPRLTFEEAMAAYGTDRPDIRFDMRIIDVTDLVKDSKFKVFSEAAAAGGRVKLIGVTGTGSMSRRELDELAAFVQPYGAKGLAWLTVGAGGEASSPIAKFFTLKELSGLVEAAGASPEDILLFVAAAESVCLEALGQLRLEMARRLGSLKKNVFKPLWVIDFPLLEWDEEENRLKSVHHPFTMPTTATLDRLDAEPLKVLSDVYDLVLNGTEVGGGGLRIHDRSLQERIFKLLNLTEQESREKFGFLLDAFDYGSPPHGGIAFGLDRLIMLLAGRDTIRDTIAFPKTQQGTDLMTGAPDTVSDAQLRELDIRLR